MTGQEVEGKTTILREYPMPYDPESDQTPYYVINEPQNIELYERYRERVEGLVNFHVVGRLAEYRYYDMDGVVASALDMSDSIINR
jgi:UDP-galactopyranose mutase